MVNGNNFSRSDTIESTLNRVSSTCMSKCVCVYRKQQKKRSFKFIVKISKANAREKKILPHFCHHLSVLQFHLSLSLPLFMLRLKIHFETKEAGEKTIVAVA
jgi:hypothetical protein